MTGKQPSVGRALVSREESGPPENWHAREGSPSPLGVSWVEEEAAYNFALYSEFATQITLLLYSEVDLSIPTYEHPLNPLANKTGRVWHCRLKVNSIPQARYYAYHVDGPRQIGEGHRFDSQKVLLDPYANCVCFPLGFSRQAAGEPSSNAGKAPLGLITQKAKYDLGNDTVPFHTSDVIGQSRKMRDVFEVATQVARRDSTVLLTGESGTGKELLAKAVHQNSLRAKKPFITIKCGAIPENLIVSELFGHRKGSFTGALSDRGGKFEAANEGTIFLDEIGDLTPSLQIRLLRVIQEREIDKIGYHNPIKVNVRILAATHRNLKTMVEDGQFREDLFYRLSVVTIHLPALRERKEDIPLLVGHFLKKQCDRHQIPPVSFSEEALQALVQHNWPGNVRELENVVEHVVVLGKDDVIKAKDLPPDIRQSKSRVANISLKLPEEGINLEEVEKEILLQALEKHHWHQTNAARYLSISRKTLIYRMEKYGLTAANDKRDSQTVPDNLDEKE